jgi:hypothetical protein
MDFWVRFEDVAGAAVTAHGKQFFYTRELGFGHVEQVHCYQMYADFACILGGRSVVIGKSRTQSPTNQRIAEKWFRDHSLVLITYRHAEMHYGRLHFHFGKAGVRFTLI